MKPRSGGALRRRGRLIAEQKLRNVFVNLYQEFNHPTRSDHDIFREPDGAAKKAKLTKWFKAVAPDIEAGICPNHLTGSDVDYPGCEVQFFQEAMPVPEHGFAVNTETADLDASGNEGVFNKFHLALARKEWEVHRESPRVAILFRSPYVEDVTGKQGQGPISRWAVTVRGERPRYPDLLRVAADQRRSLGLSPPRQGKQRCGDTFWIHGPQSGLRR